MFKKKKLIDALYEKNLFEEHVSSKNVATFYMVVNDDVASSVASYKYT